LFAYDRNKLLHTRGDVKGFVKIFSPADLSPRSAFAGRVEVSVGGGA
jgi:hypothetical protein